jgi:fatty acid desaturase
MSERPDHPAAGRSVVDIARSPVYFKQAKALSRTSDAMGVFTLAWLWGVMALAAAAAIYSESWYVYPIAMVAIASRQHALGVLMHDASHYKLLSNRTLNDLVGNLLCALPVGMTVARYRADHSRHHQAPNTDRDPYFAIFQKNPRSWQWPKPQREACGVLARDLTGLHMPDLMRETANWGPWQNHFSQSLRPPPLTLSERATVYSFYGVVLALVAMTGAWLKFLLLWVVPFIMIAPFLIRIRSLGEHFGLPGEGNEATRHIDGTWYERWAFSPLNSNHHLTHHLFPSVPWFNLPKMTAVLFADPEFSQAAHRSATYIGMMRDELIVEGIDAVRALRTQAEPRSA